MRCHFVLVNPARGENVGFAARAIKTMGFSALRIVGGNIQDSTEARKTAYGAHDILDSTVIYTSLKSALEDLHLTIGTTSKQRIKRYDSHTPKEIYAILKGKTRISPEVGLVFGSEENGLSTYELDLCDLVSSIPLSGEYPSLNLAQSVLIYAWEISEIKSYTPETSPVNNKLQDILKTEAMQLLEKLEIDGKPLLLQRIMDRVMLLNNDDTELLMTVLRKLRRQRLT